ncbi:cell division protein FtsQ/DivIB [Cellulosimicrobium funkei]|uniref:cell division protein FtsQ/DivIB n=2 Tax=Cellulosimicrobium TaxID=157920 RepID=UPI0037A7D4CC
MRPPPQPRPAAPRPGRSGAGERAGRPAAPDPAKPAPSSAKPAPPAGARRAPVEDTPTRPVRRVAAPGSELVRSSGGRPGTGRPPAARGGGSRGAGPTTSVPRGASAAPIGVVSHGMAERLAERDAMRRHRVRTRVLGWVAGLLVAAGLAWVAFFSPVLGLDLDKVTVSGEGTVIDPQQVRDVVAAADGVPLPRLDTVALREQVLDLNGVRDVEIRRAWPSGLSVLLESREPVVAVPVDDGFALLDADGVHVRTDPVVPEGLPEIDAPLDDQGARALDAALVLLNALPADLHAQVAEVSAPTRDAVRMTLRDGVVVEWGSSEEAALKVRVLQTLRAVPENAGVTVYDVSAPRLPVTR